MRRHVCAQACVWEARVCGHVSAQACVMEAFVCRVRFMCLLDSSLIAGDVGGQSCRDGTKARS